MNFSERLAEVRLPLREGMWDRVFCSADTRWAGAGEVVAPELLAASEVRFALSPYSAVLYTLRGEPVTNR